MKRLFLMLTTALLALAGVRGQAYYVGGDISLLSKYEANKQAYYDQQGGAIADVLAYMKSDAVGWNAQRVRLFVNPENASAGDKSGGVCQDLDYVTALARRIKAAGFALMIDFHYSDSWADPGKQTKPKAWESMTTAQLTEQVYTYTKACLEHLVANGAHPDMIQVGNEISFGMLWPEAKVDAYHDTNWSVLAGYVKSGVKACREVCPQARVIIHTEQAKSAVTTRNYYQRMVDAGVDFDVIGLSYYPFWHGTLTELGATLDACATAFPAKQVQIVETAYYYQWMPSDLPAQWTASTAGQTQFATDLVAELRGHDNVTGLFWWFPEENGNGNGTLGSWLNRGLWDNSTHRALPALYVLKQFTAGRESAIVPVEESVSRASACYSLLGHAVDNTYQGLVICDGKKRLQTAR